MPFTPQELYYRPGLEWHRPRAHIQQLGLSALKMASKDFYGDSRDMMAYDAKC